MTTEENVQSPADIAIAKALAEVTAQADKAAFEAMSDDNQITEAAIEAEHNMVQSLMLEADNLVVKETEPEPDTYNPVTHKVKPKRKIQRPGMTLQSSVPVGNGRGTATNAFNNYKANPNRGEYRIDENRGINN